MRTILAIEYPGPYAKTQLRQLGLETRGYTTRYLLQEMLPRETRAAEYAAALYQRCALAGVDIAQIVAYCAAGEIARELLPLCAQRSGDRVRLTVINPERPNAEVLHRTLEAALRRTIPGQDGTAPAAESYTVAMFEAMEMELADTILAKAGSAGDAVATDLSRMQIDWAIHLVAAANTSAVPTQDELHIVSADHLCPVVCPARHICVCASAGDVFLAPGVVQTVIG